MAIFMKGKCSTGNGTDKVRMKNGSCCSGSGIYCATSGKMTYTDGSFYDGSWHNGKKEGEGK
jgi:hypothetical protein